MALCPGQRTQADKGERHHYCRGRRGLASIEDIALDTAGTCVEFASGDIGSACITWGLSRRVTAGGFQDVIAPKGVLQWVQGGLKITTKGGKETLHQCERPNPDVLQAQYFLRCVRGEGQAPAEPTARLIDTARDGRIALQMCLVVLQSIETGGVVKL